jgi:UDP-glucose 4-epimerase
MNLFISGGAGFIGSNLVNTIVKDKSIKKITVYDNFSSGKKWFLKKNKKIVIVKGDIKNKKKLSLAIKDSNLIYHFAANPDIAAAVKNPDIDFVEGTVLLRNVLEAMRLNNIKKIIFASGSGVYGDLKNKYLFEDKTVTRPISTYGASKLYCESLISSYVNLVGFKGISFRFANVVGDNSTHGVCYDFVKKIYQNKNKIHILGNGKQSKSYLHVTDVVNALIKVKDIKNYEHRIFNLSTIDFISVNKILKLTLKEFNLKNIKCVYTGGNKGWKGDVPIVRINDKKFRKLGWSNKLNCKQSIVETIKFLKKNKDKYKF